MIEAVIAGAILVSFLTLLSFSNIEREETDLSSQAYRLLQGLNRQGLLKANAVALNYTAINNKVRYYAYNHSVQICTPQQCYGSQPSGSNVWVGSYIVPGEGVYSPYEVKLYLFR